MRAYRHKDKPTNVLSFAGRGECFPTVDISWGELVICAPVVAFEAARAQGKALCKRHWGAHDGPTGYCTCLDSITNKLLKRRKWHPAEIQILDRPWVFRTRIRDPVCSAPMSETASWRPPPAAGICF